MYTISGCSYVPSWLSLNFDAVFHMVLANSFHPYLPTKLRSSEPFRLADSLCLRSPALSSRVPSEVVQMTQMVVACIGIFARAWGHVTWWRVGVLNRLGTGTSATWNAIAAPLRPSSEKKPPLDRSFRRAAISQFSGRRVLRRGIRQGFMRLSFAAVISTSISHSILFVLHTEYFLSATSINPSFWFILNVAQWITRIIPYVVAKIMVKSQFLTLPRLHSIATSWFRPGT